MKKHLIVTEVFFPEDFVINDLAKDWEDRGVNFDVFTRNPSYPKDKIFDGFKNRLFSKSSNNHGEIYRIFTFLGYQSSVLKKALNYVIYMILSFFFVLCKGRKYDKVFIYQTGPLSNAFSFTLLKWIYGYKIIIWTQDVWPDSVFAFGVPEKKVIQRVLNSFVRFIYRRCDKILISCEGFAPKLNSLLGGSRDMTWVPNWPLMSDEVELQPLKWDDEKLNLTFAGNIGKVQNLENIILAVHQSENTDQIVFHIVGDGSNLSNLKALVEKLNVKNIVFHGRQPLELMPSYFNASDLLLISLIDKPIFSITIPSKFQAYLTSKKPLFGAINGELKEIIEKYQIGFTAAPNNVEEIRQKLDYVIANKQLLNEMGDNTNKLLKKYFEKEKNIQLINELVQTC